MRLTIELVPSTCWYKNIRAVVSRDEWDVIRRKTYKEAGGKCSVCHSKVKLYCHEVWCYDDVRYIQRLVGFIALCNLCHMVKHLGYAGVLAMQGKLKYDSLIGHFTRVNECSVEEFEQHRQTAFDVWEKRSEHEWITEMSLLSMYARSPQLRL